MGPKNAHEHYTTGVGSPMYLHSQTLSYCYHLFLFALHILYSEQEQVHMFYPCIYIIPLGGSITALRSRAFTVTCTSFAAPFTAYAIDKCVTFYQIVSAPV